MRLVRRRGERVELPAGVLDTVHHRGETAVEAAPGDRCGLCGIVEAGLRALAKVAREPARAPSEPMPFGPRRR
jgi:hypothetical protein